MENNTFLKMTGFKFCPSCKSNNLEDRPSSFVCNDCGYVYFHGTAAATSCILTDDKNQILLIKRKRDPGKGLYDLPGGFVDYDESLLDGMKRELSEEINIIPKDLSFYTSRPNKYRYKSVLYHTCDCFFIGRIDDNSNINAGDDAEEIILVKLDKVDLSLFAFDSVKSVLSKYLKI